MNRRKILIIENRAASRHVLLEALDKRYEATSVGSMEDGRSFLQGNACDAVIIGRSTWLAGERHVAEIGNAVHTEIIAVVESECEASDYLELSGMGATEFVEEPVEVDRLVRMIERVVVQRDLRIENRQLRKRLRSVEGTRRMVGNSSAMQQIQERLGLVAETRAPVIITGESGTGKGMLAYEIHARSDRAEGPFVKINCAALPGPLLDSELFGREKSVSQGITRTIPGKFETADGGTIVLDEIGEMSPTTQAKLLAVMNDGEFVRVGGSDPVHVDIRIIATSREDLQPAIQRNRFREDLFYRLNVVPIDIPPLRERREDIPVLIEHFARAFTTKAGKEPIRLTEAALTRLCSADWRGNVRELENVIERAVILASGATLDANYFRFDIGSDNRLAEIERTFCDGSVREMEKLMIVHRLIANDQNRTKTARTLDISVRTLRNKLREYREAEPAATADRPGATSRQQAVTVD